MNKLLILLSAAVVIQSTLALSLGDTMNQKIAAQTNTTTSATKLIASSTKSSTFQQVANNGSSVKYMVNNKTNRIYSINWQQKQPANLQNILGNPYYSQYQAATKKPQLRIPLRGIVIDNGDLSVSQFGSMLSGIQGTATVRSLTP